MFEFYEKRRIKKFIYSKGFFGILSILVLLMSYAAYGAYGKMEGTIERRATLQAQLAELEDRADSLEEDIERLNDPRGLESELRTRYEVGWEGEEVVVLVDEEEKRGVEKKEEIEEERGFWSELFDN